MNISKINRKSKDLTKPIKRSDDIVDYEDEEEFYEEKLPTVDEWKDVDLRRKGVKKKQR